MEILKFRLSGETAFFKKPDVNSYFYYTYNNIHKIALLGILGSILGLKGYNQQRDYNAFPEFYEKLKDIKLSVVPLKDSFNKKIQTFTNTSGFYNEDSNKLPCTLLYKEQWLENPEWEIYILLDDSDLLQELKDRLINLKFVYNPYLGSNKHFANIDEIKVIEDYKIINNANRIDSLYNKKDFAVTGKCNDDPNQWKTEEYLPVGLQDHTNLYNIRPFVNTNMSIEGSKDIWVVNEKNLYFE